MVRAFAVCLGLVALLPLPASAHGPTRQKVVETIEIDAPPDKVWAAIGNFQDMSWHPVIAKTEGSGGNDAGATRVLTTKDGGKIGEKLAKFDAAAKSYSYEITEVEAKALPVSNYSATISVKDAGGKSAVEWKGAFYRFYVNNDPPPDQDDAAAVAAVTGIYKSGLDALKKKVEGGS
jgi:hypothetical protein